MKKVTVVIPTYNSQGFIANCLNSMFAQTFNDYEVIVVDNHSSDETVQILKKYPVRIMEMKKNYGWAGCNNIALRNISTPYVVLLNIDTIVDKEWLLHLVELADTDKHIGAISSTILEYQDYPSISRGYPLYFDINSGLIVASQPTKRDVPVSFVPGTAMLMNLQTSGQEAHFREDFFMYHEDVEFSLRVLSKIRCKLFFSGKAIIWHDSKQSFKNPLTCDLAIRNLFRCLITYQTKKEFMLNQINYWRTFSRLYPFYRQYYPKRYPLAVFKNILYSIYFLARKRNEDTVREILREINQPIKCNQSFSFIF